MLYKLDTDDIQRSARTKIASLNDFDMKEKDLENFLRSRLTDVVFEDELMLISQERAFQAEADLLALDIASRRTVVRREPKRLKRKAAS